MNKPNILFILTDQQRYDALSCRGTSIAKTPNMDKLASEGVRFDNAYTQCPLCVPARLSLLTGQHTHEHKVYINEHKIDERTVTWPQILKDDGYDTFAFGKTHGVYAGFEKIAPPYDRTYDCGSGPDAGEGNELFDWPHAPWPHGRTVFKTKEPKENIFDFKVAEQVNEKFSELQNSDKPWAMQVGIFYPHPPYILPEPYASMYDHKDIEVPEFDKSELTNKPVGQINMHERFFDLPKEQKQKMIAGYWSCVAMADDCVGAILDKLKELGMDENTIVCLTSDHGDLNGEHGLFSKFSSCYDAEARVPMIWRWNNKIKSGKVIDDMVETIDLVPTILEATNNEIPLTNSGKSLLSLLKNDKQEKPHREYVTAVTGCYEFPELRPFGHMLRTPQWKLVYYPNDKSELYDMVNDPKEITNLYYEEKHADIANELKEKLLKELI